MSNSGFSLTVSDPDELMIQAQIEVKPTSVEEVRLREQAKSSVDFLLNFDIDNLSEKKNVVDTVESFGMDNMQRSVSKSAILKNSINTLSKSGSEGSMISKGLLDIQAQVKVLDPSSIDFTQMPGFMGRVATPIKNYFQRYQKADAVIADIIESLDAGKQTLRDDNTTLEIERQALRDLSKKLIKESELAGFIDDEVMARLSQAEANNEDEVKIKFIREEILFPLRQKIMDINQRVVVNQQGYVAMTLIINNNKELIRGVDRVKSVTLPALETAVTVASALFNQKLVLQSVQALNKTTGDMIAATSRMLKEQGTVIHKQSIEANLSPEQLMDSFKVLFEALDEVSNFKQKALPSMKRTIDTFRDMAERGEREILQIERGSALALPVVESN